MVVDLAIAMGMGMKTDTFMDIGIAMSIAIRSNMVPKFCLIDPKNMTNLVKQLSEIGSKIVQHGAKMRPRTAF